jgi:hypothetical protein
MCVSFRLERLVDGQTPDFRPQTSDLCLLRSELLLERACRSTEAVKLLNMRSEVCSLRSEV